jgi:hypothetical protein
MTSAKDQTGGMGRLSKEARKKVDLELKDEEITLLEDTKVDLESLRPQISDEESFNKLIEAVKAATDHNESIAELRQRITDFGEGAVKVAKEVFDIIKKF